MSRIRIVGPMLGGPSDIDGLWLKHYDPNAREGRGQVTATPDIEEAMRFLDHRAALDCWRQQSTVLPLRPDGRPNRPFTAYSVEIVP